jgi:hypothetical protein
MKMSELLSEKDMGKHNNATTGFKALAKKAGGGEKGAKIAGAQFQKMKKAGQLEERSVAESRRNYDDNRTGFSDQSRRDFKRAEMEHELGHETNNYAVAIDGKTWKVFGSKSHAEAVARSLQNKGKKATVHETGAEISESASAGATSSASIGTVDAPHISPGKARGKKSYTGSPGTGSGTKAPPQPKVVQPKTKAGTAKNGLDIKSASLFGGPANEAAVIKRR